MSDICVMCNQRKELYQKMKMKYFLFITIFLLLHFTFWYYITCFCSTRTNSLYIWIKALGISLFFNYFLTQTLIPLIKSILRYFALSYRSSLIRRMYYIWIKYIY